MSSSLLSSNPEQPNSSKSLPNVTPVGKYNLYIRDHYVAYRTAKYLIDHPGVSQRRAAKYARVAWARKVKK